MKIFVMSFSIIGLCLMLHCRILPPWQTRMVIRPPLADIVGQYSLTYATLTVDSSFQKALDDFGMRPSIFIQTDGVFTATNCPLFVCGDSIPGYIFSGFRDVVDNWNADVVGAMVVDGSTTPFFGIRLINTNGETSVASFFGEGSVEGLVFVLGDPDSYKIIVYEKVRDDNGPTHEL